MSAPMTADMADRKCPTCGQRAAEMTTKTLEAWEASNVAPCPKCIRRYHGSGPARRTSATCAGCSKAAPLTDGVCRRCQDKGVAALNLFGAE